MFLWEKTPLHLLYLRTQICPLCVWSQHWRLLGKRGAARQTEFICSANFESIMLTDDKYVFMSVCCFQLCLCRMCVCECVCQWTRRCVWPWLKQTYLSCTGWVGKCNTCCDRGTCVCVCVCMEMLGSYKHEMKLCRKVQPGDLMVF